MQDFSPLWEQHVRDPRFQQVGCARWGVSFLRLLPVIVSFEEFKTPAFTSAFTSPRADCLPDVG